MSADHIAYRVEKYESMGFSYAESVTLAHTYDDNNIALYWFDVKKLLEKTGDNHAQTLDILIAFPQKGIEYEDIGGPDDGAYSQGI